MRRSLALPSIALGSIAIIALAGCPQFLGDYSIGETDAADDGGIRDANDGASLVDKAVGVLIGDPCKSDATCSYPNGVCATSYPDGLCTAACTDTCPVNEAKVATFCASFQQSGYCLPVCNPSMPVSCRAGYSCKKVQKFGSTTVSEYVCGYP